MWTEDWGQQEDGLTIWYIGPFKDCGRFNDLYSRFNWTFLKELIICMAFVLFIHVISVSKYLGFVRIVVLIF